MADTAVAITSGTGTNIDVRTESTNGDARQVVVLGDPTANAGVAPVDGTAGLKVDLGADNDITGTVTANAGTNLNTSALALESGGNLDAILAKLDVSLGSRLASGSTLPITGTVDARSAGGSLTVYQGNNPWQVTMSTLSSVVSGSVTANAGTNLNTSLLALESGGNLATIAGKDFATQTTLASILAKLDVSLGSRLASGSTLPITGTITANQGGLWGVNISAMPAVTIDTTGLALAAKQDTGNSTLASILANLDVPLSTRLASGSTLPITGTINQGNAGSQAWLVTLATLSVIGSFTGGSALATVTSIQGDPGSKAWLATMATLPVMAGQVGTWSVTANAGTNLNTSALALESGGNLATIAGKDFATQTTLASILSKLDVNLSTRLASGSTLPVTGTLGAINAGGTLTAYQGLAGSSAWLMTMATLPVMANVVNTVPVSGTFWQATQPVSLASAVPVTDNSGSLTVDYATTGSGTATGALRVEIANNGTGLVGLNAGTNAIGKLAANSGVDIGDVDVTSIAAGTNNIGQVSVAPQTANGLSVFNATSSDGATALTSTAQVIKASAGQVYGWYIYNPNSSAQFVQFYNTAAASVTVGTTNPLFMLTIPATSAANVEFTNGITFSNAGFSISATSTAGGNGAPSTALDAVIFYK